MLRSASGMMSDAWESKSLAASSFFNLGAPVAIVLTVVMWICGLISKIFAYFRAGMLPILVGGTHVGRDELDGDRASRLSPRQSRLAGRVPGLQARRRTGHGDRLGRSWSRPAPATTARP